MKKILSTVILIALIFLAVSSGVTKVLLMPQDVEFFGRYGISGLILVALGMIQIVGGVLLMLKRTRFTGAAVVATTFLLSLVMLLMDGNFPVSVATVIATLLLGMIMKQNLSTAASDLQN